MAPRVCYKSHCSDSFLLRKVGHTVGCVLARTQFGVEKDAWVQAPTLHGLTSNSCSIAGYYEPARIVVLILIVLMFIALGRR